MPFFSPLMLASLAASGLGTVITQRQEQQNRQRMIDARNAVLLQNQQRQRQFADQAGAEVAGATEQFEAANQEQQRADIKSDQTERFKGATRDDIDYHYGDRETPANLRNAVVQRSAEGKATSDRNAENLAGMNSFTQGLFNNGMGLHESGRNVASIADTAGGMERLVPIEMSAAANNAYEQPSGLGSLLQLAGGAGSMYAGGGGTFDDLFGGGGVTPSAGFGEFIKKSLKPPAIPQNPIVASGGYY